MKKKKKKDLRNSRLCRPSGLKSKNQRKREENKRTKNSVEHESNGMEIGALKQFPKAGRVVNRRTSQDHPNYSIIKVGQYTKESLGNLRRLAFSKTRHDRVGEGNPLGIVQAV